MPTCKCSLLDEIEAERRAVAGLECANRLLRLRNEDQAAELKRFKAFFSANADELQGLIEAERAKVAALKETARLLGSACEDEAHETEMAEDEIERLGELQCPHKPTCAIAKITGVEL